MHTVKLIIEVKLFISVTIIKYVPGFEIDIHFKT